MNDAEGAYLAHVRAQQQRSGAQAASRMLRGSAPQGNVGAGAAVGAPVASGAQPPQKRSPFDKGAMRITEGEKKLLSGAGDAASAIASDIGTGLIEAPLAVVGGVRDALQNSVVAAVDNLAMYLERNMPLGGIQIGESGLPEYVTPEALAATRAQEGGPQLPDVAGQNTVTGKTVREASRYLTGFLPAFRAMKAAGAGNITSGLAAGFATDFATADPDGERLSDFWRSAGLPQNVVTDYLASDPSDSEAEKRFKSAVEGAGIGVLAEGVMSAARVTRAAMKATAPPAAGGKPLQPGAVEPVLPTVTEEDLFAPLGAKDGPALVAADKLLKAEAATATGTPADVAAKGLVRVADDGGREVFINFARIDEPDSIKKTIGLMADAFAPEIDDARRGVMTFEETSQLADDLGYSVEDLLNRTKGQPLNAETALAARRLLNASATKLTELAEKAAGPSASDVDMFSFRKMLATHHAIQTEVISARTETARALASWRIEAGSDAERAAQITQALDAFGGRETASQIAARLVQLKALNRLTPGNVSRIAQAGFGARAQDAIGEAYTMSLLSSPTTHIVNFTSSFSTTLQGVYERAAAGWATPDEVAAGEALAMLHQFVIGQRKALRLGWDAFKMGEARAVVPSKFDDPRQAISAGNFNMENTPGGRALDFIGAVFNVPGRLMAGTDEYWKSLNFDMQLNALAVRKAAQEGLTGDEAAQRTAALVANPPDDLMMTAREYALGATFQENTGAFGKSMLKLRSSTGLFGRVVMPFVKTPVNIFRYSMERTPLAPIVGQWRADYAAGGSRRTMAVTRAATGTALFMAAADLAMKGHISGAGPSDPEERQSLARQGWQPFSIKIGSKWYSYNRVDPFGMTFGMAATWGEWINQAPPDDMQVQARAQDPFVSAVVAISQSVVNKTYMQGISGAIAALQEPDRYAASYLKDVGSGFMPFGPLLGAAERATDPETRLSAGIMEDWQSRFPYLSQALPLRRNLWGEPIKRDSGLGPVYDSLSPVGVSKAKESPIDREFNRLRYFPPGVPFGVVNVDGVPIDLKDWPQVHSEWTRLMGNALPDPAFGKGMKDRLNDLVTGKDPLSPVYAMKPDEKKTEMIRNTISSYRERALREILRSSKFGDFKNFVDSQRLVMRNRSQVGANPLMIQAQ